MLAAFDTRLNPRRVQAFRATSCTRARKSSCWTSRELLVRDCGGNAARRMPAAGAERRALSRTQPTSPCPPRERPSRPSHPHPSPLPTIHRLRAEGAAHGKGRGRQVVAVAKSSDLVLMVLDAGKEYEKNHRAILEAELEAVGMRLNKQPPQIYLKKKARVRVGMAGSACGVYCE